MPPFLPSLRWDASAELPALLINTNFWRGSGGRRDLPMGGAERAGDHRLRAEVSAWAHAFFIGCTQGYFYFFLFPPLLPSP